MSDMEILDIIFDKLIDCLVEARINEQSVKSTNYDLSRALDVAAKRATTLAGDLAAEIKKRSDDHLIVKELFNAASAVRNSVADGVAAKELHEALDAMDTRFDFLPF